MNKPKRSNMQNRDNLARNKAFRDAWVRRQDPEIYSNGKKFKALLKKVDKHRRMHGKNGKKRR